MATLTARRSPNGDVLISIIAHLKHAYEWSDSSCWWREASCDMSAQIRLEGDRQSPSLASASTDQSSASLPSGLGLPAGIVAAIDQAPQMCNASAADDVPERGHAYQMCPFDFFVGFLLPCIFCLLGIVGNVVSLVVLASDRSMTPTFITLKALAASDIVLLVCAFLQQVVPIYLEVSGCVHPACLRINYIRIYAWPFICIAQMTSIWLALVISAERYSAICRPLETYGLPPVGKIKASIWTVAIFSVLFNLPRFFEFTSSEEPLAGSNLTYVAVADSGMRLDPVYRYLYNTALFFLCVYAAPMAGITLLNASIVTHVRRAKRRWSSLNRTQRRAIRATVMPLCIVGICLLCGTQSLISFVLDAIFVQRDLPWIRAYTAVVNLFVVVNSAVNFLVFFSFGSKFQKLFRRKIACPPRSDRLQNSQLLRQFSSTYRPRAFSDSARASRAQAASNPRD